MRSFSFALIAALGLLIGAPSFSGLADAEANQADVVEMAKKKKKKKKVRKTKKKKKGKKKAAPKPDGDE